MKEEEAGTIIGIVTFALYLMPVITGALGDRFGYKKMFLLAYAILTPCYYLLGTFSTYGGFLLGFMFVAVGAAIFKPVVVGTVARVTNEQTSQLGFGVFYMMVNVGGFLGPAISGYLRGPDPVTDLGRLAGDGRRDADGRVEHAVPQRVEVRHRRLEHDPADPHGLEPGR